MNDQIHAEGPAEDRTIALLTHLSMLVLGFILPLIIWLTNKDKPEKAWLTEHAKEALNFVISLSIVFIALGIFMAIIGFIPVIGWLIALLLWFAMMALAVAALVLVIIAAIKANDGGFYAYPGNLRLIK